MQKSRKSRLWTFKYRIALFFDAKKNPCGQVKHLEEKAISQQFSTDSATLLFHHFQVITAIVSVKFIVVRPYFLTCRHCDDKMSEVWKILFQLLQKNRGVGQMFNHIKERDYFD